MAEIKSDERAAYELSRSIINASKRAEVDPNPFSPPYNELPVQDDCDNTFSDLAHLTTITAHWCRFLAEDIIAADHLLNAADSASSRTWG